MIRVLLSLACAFLCTFEARAALTMQVDFDQHFEAGEDQSNVPPDTHVSATLTVVDRQFVLDTPTERSVYDFRTRRRNVIDLASHTRVDYSLYDSVGFRVFEYRNRIGIARALAAAKIDRPGMNAIASENSLSIQEKAASPLRVADDGVEKSFRDGDQVLFRASDAATAATPADVALFVQMLRYRIGGHPQVLSALAATNAIPEHLVFTFTGAGRSTMTVNVRSIHAIDGTPVDVLAVAKRRAANDPVDRTLDRATALKPADVDVIKQRCRTDLAAALRENRLLDVALGIAEWGLMTGDPLAPLTPEQRQHVSTDPAVMKLSGALGGRSADQARAALPVLESLRADAPHKAYVLDLFIANDRKAIGDAAGARDLFVEVLAENPAIAGAYKDLGDALLMRFDMARGWRSWDEGRHLYPGFANFSAVDQFEKSLAADHPEYF